MEAILSITSINGRVVERIRERYTNDDEIRMLRSKPNAETAAYHDWVEECLYWGRLEKANLGLELA